MVTKVTRYVERNVDTPVRLSKLDHLVTKKKYELKSELKSRLKCTNRPKRTPLNSIKLVKGLIRCKSWRFLPFPFPIRAPLLCRVKLKSTRVVIQNRLSVLSFLRTTRLSLRSNLIMKSCERRSAFVGSIATCP